MLYNTKKEVYDKGIKIIGITLGSIDKTSRLSKSKGSIGQVVENDWFGIFPGSSPKPDFGIAEVELKVTPYKKNKKGIAAKERLVCNIINYMKEHSLTFKTSSFWNKCKVMLIMSYEHKESVSKALYTIEKVVLLSLDKKEKAPFITLINDKDVKIMEEDYNTIIDKIKKGKAHLLSEKDTYFLGACPKGASKSSLRKQPFSDIPAMQRAFCLKQSYMTEVLNNYIFNLKPSESIITAPISETFKFKDYILDKIKPHIGKTVKELINKYNIQSTAKNINEIIVSKILGLKGKISNSDEFKKANIKVKTIRVNKNNKIKESMSFPYFDFIKLSKEKWEDSDLKNMFDTTIFFFIIFKENQNGDYILEKVMFWTIPLEDLEEIKNVWEKTKSIINIGVELETINGKTYNNFPKKTENKVSHVRPHAINTNDTLKLPDGRKMPKQCFWLNNTYIEKQIGLK